MEWDLNFYCTVRYVATMLHLTAEPHSRPVAWCMYHIISLKTENIAVNEIGRIICSHLLEGALSYFLYKIIKHAWRNDV